MRVPRPPRHPETLTVFHPEFGQYIRVEEYDRPEIDDDEVMTAQTIGILRDETIAAGDHPRVIDAAQKALKQAGLTNYSTFDDKTDAVFWWVKQNVSFVREEVLERPFNLRLDTDLDQALTPPPDLLTMPHMQGDCTIFSMLVASMLRALGIGSAFKTIAADPRIPQAYSHVYVEAQDPNDDKRLKPLDASNGPEPGTEYSPVWKAKLWEIDNMSAPASRLHGLGDFDWDSFSTTLANDVTKIATPILTARYAVPQVNSGQIYQTKNAQGTSIVYQQPTGSSTSLLPTVEGSGGSNIQTYLIYGCIALAAVVVLKR